MMNTPPETTVTRTREDARAAFYIAGQAVIAMIEGLTVTGATICGEDDEPAWINVEHYALPETGGLGGSNRKEAESIIRASLAGIAAEDKDGYGKPRAVLNIKDPESMRDDAVFRAAGLARRITSRAGVVLPVLWREVAATVSAPRTWAGVTAVAELLLRDGTANGKAIARAADDAMSGRV